MTAKRTTFAAALALALIVSGIRAAFAFADPYSPDAAVGVWFTSDKSAKVEIFERDGKYHGKIVWGKDVTETSRDKENPDPELRDRKIKGLVILQGFVYEGDGEWEDGTIYDPESGSTYSCTMRLTDRNTLKVRGYMGISLLGRTEVWTRAE